MGKGKAESKKKAAVGETGAELRFYKQKEHAKLSDEQKDELREHRKSSNTGQGHKKKIKWNEDDLKKHAASSIKAAKKKNVEDSNVNNERIRGHISGLFEDKDTKKSAPGGNGGCTSASSITLNSILCRASQQKKE